MGYNFKYLFKNNIEKLFVHGQIVSEEKIFEIKDFYLNLIVVYSIPHDSKRWEDEILRLCIKIKMNLKKTQYLNWNHNYFQHDLSCEI